jgi:hypothetical protein
MEDGIDSAKLLSEFTNTIRIQLRTFGVLLYDDAGNRIKPGPEEDRVISNIARNCVQIVVTKPECQTKEVGSDS